MKLSPMMQQYLGIKEQYKDCILFFRLGDFYEMFFEDAKLASRLLELTLTGKNCGLEERAPMCGVPFHAADSYIAKLAGMGYKVAVCEQLEDPKTTKGMVKRGVVRVVTPGTLTAETVLQEKENNYLASVYADSHGAALSYCDISTGELCATEQDHGTGPIEDIINELVKINAREILVNEEAASQCDETVLKKETGAFIHTMPEEYFSEKSAMDAIRTQFQSLSLTALGLEGKKRCLLSLGALLSYLFETQKQNLRQVTGLRYYEIGNHMSLDKATIRNLEITETLYDKNTAGSLLGVLDKTNTAVGARKLKQWIREPLNNTQDINLRLDAVEELTRDPLKLNDLREALRRVYDFERLAGRIASGNANGRDMIALGSSISLLPEIREEIQHSDSRLLQNLAEEIIDLSAISTEIETMIVDDPPAVITSGELIRDGYSSELDAMKDSISDAKNWIAGLETKEKERTGITHLKVGYNKVFGYYIEVSRSNLDLVPDDYIRKQTLVGAERFITPKLKEMEGIVLNAETRINQLEYDLFTGLRTRIGEKIPEIQKVSRAVANIDVLVSFARVSIQNNYIRPTVDDSYTIEIEQGRHPVIEKTTEQGLFVSNDTYLNNTSESMLIITGPNMAGKSTYMRQTALIVLMAQIGCFVPAAKARIGLVDRIFTRIGASDNLAQGQSTFFVEMSELAYILRSAGPRSLIVLDEIGRGTSTYDGLSIAWAAVEYLCNEKRKIRTLFATHYHELTVLEERIKGVRNLNVDVAEENGNIVFLHKIVPGSANRSYGIHVARLAGVPSDLLHSAEARLKQLEGQGKNNHELPDEPQNKEDAAGQGRQLSFFSPGSNPAAEKLRNLDLMEITPSEAIRILEELKKLAEE